MIRTNVIRLYPTRAQEAQLNNTAGACRFAWNKALGYWDEQYEAHLKDKSVPAPISSKVASWYKDNSSLMGAIRWQLSYKVQHLIKVNRFFPSSKTCSNCGHIRSDLTVGERTYHCDHCGAVIDRDLNAAINLMKSGLVKPEASVE